jgi:hypothetical protein
LFVTHTVTVHCMSSHTPYSLKTDRGHIHCFEVILLFFISQFFKFVHRYFFISSLDHFCLNLLLLFSFDILMFLAICYMLLIQTLSKLHENFLGSYVSQHQTNCMLLRTVYCCRHFIHQVDI